eukprot:1402707-Amphidinium_carterae.1
MGNAHVVDLSNHLGTAFCAQFQQASFGKARHKSLRLVWIVGSGTLNRQRLTVLVPRPKSGRKKARK